MSLGELLGPNDWAECKQCGVGEGKPLQQTLTDPDGLDVGTCSPGRPARTRHGSGGPRPVRRAFEKLAQIIRHLDGFIVSRCKKRVHPQGSMTNMNVFRWLETTETTKPKIWVWRAKKKRPVLFCWRKSRVYFLMSIRTSRSKLGSPHETRLQKVQRDVLCVPSTFLEGIPNQGANSSNLNDGMQVAQNHWLFDCNMVSSCSEIYCQSRMMRWSPLQHVPTRIESTKYSRMWLEHTEGIWVAHVQESLDDFLQLPSGYLT